MAKVMAAYRRVYDSRQLQADCQGSGISSGTPAQTARDQLRNPTLGNRVWATFTFILQNRRSWAVYGAETGGVSLG